MACSEGRKLQAYMEAQLSLPDRTRLEGHLSRCAACRQELAEKQQLEGLLAELSPLAAPPDLLASTLARARRELRPARRSTALWPTAMTAASAVAAVLLIFLQLGTPKSPPHATQPVVASLELGHRLLTPALDSSAATHATRPVAQRRFAPRFQSATVRTGPRIAKAAPVSSAAVAAPPPLEVVAAAAYREAAGHAAGDPELSVAALENVALAYPHSRQAAKALLAAGGLERRRGNLTEADVVYRRVLALPAQTSLSQGLAHKALGDMRRESVGDDEVALYHYNQAAQALRAETGSRGQAPQNLSLVALAEVERQMGQRDRAAADYATVVNSGTRSAVGEQTALALAEVL